MKKSTFVSLILGTIGMAFFALGMCMCLLPQWGLMQQGKTSGGIGLVVLLATVFLWRRMEGKAFIKPHAKTVVITVLSVFGALLLGVGMSLCLVFGQMTMGIGIAIGTVGLLILFTLLMLIPLSKGLQ